MSSPTASETQSHISRALCEVLDSVVAPRVREIVLDDALAASNEASLPTEPDQLVDFVRGALRNALLEAVGEDSIDVITADLERIIALASPSLSGCGTFETPRTPADPPTSRRRRALSSRPRFPAVTTNRNATIPYPHPRVPTSRPSFRTAPTPRFPAPHVPPPSEPSAPPISSGPFPRGTAAALSMAGVRSSHPPGVDAATPLVIVASVRPSLARRLAKSLASHVEIITIHSVMGLVREVSRDDGRRIALLLDCDALSIRALSVAALADELPSNVQVVLWGATPELKASLVSVSTCCQTWTGIAQHTDLDDIAGRCAILVC